MLGKLAFLHRNLTAPTRRPPAADAFDIDAKLARGLYDRRPEAKRPRLPRA